MDMPQHFPGSGGQEEGSLGILPETAAPVTQPGYLDVWAFCMKKHDIPLSESHFQGNTEDSII